MDRDTSGLKPRKTPIQERSRALVDALRTAAVQLLVEGGLDAVTVPALCERAGVSPGSFYQYYPHKEAVFYELLREHAADVTTAMGALVTGAADAPIEAVVRGAVDAFVDAHADAPEVHAALGAVVSRVAGPGLEPDLAAPFEAVLVQVMRARPDDLRDRDPEPLAFLAYRTLEGAVHAAARDRPALLGQPAFREGLVTMLTALLD